jgi:hypothetical protein
MHAGGDVRRSAFLIIMVAVPACDGGRAVVVAGILPAGLPAHLALMTVSTDRAYGVHYDELGVEYIVVYELVTT